MTEINQIKHIHLILNDEVMFLNVKNNMVHRGCDESIVYEIKNFINNLQDKIDSKKSIYTKNQIIEIYRPNINDYAKVLEKYCWA